MQVGRNWVIYLGLKSDPKTPRSQESSVPAGQGGSGSSGCPHTHQDIYLHPRDISIHITESKGGPNKHQMRLHTRQITSSSHNLPPSLPPKITQVMSSNTPCPHPTRNNFHTFFFLNAKNPLKMQISPKETQATYKNRRHDRVLKFYTYINRRAYRQPHQY